MFSEQKDNMSIISSDPRNLSRCQAFQTKEDVFQV